MEKTTKAGIIKRTLKMIRVGSKYFLFFKLNKHKNDSLGKRLRLACEELGLVFIKLGQILSTRYDLLPETAYKELQKLLDNVPPFSSLQVKEIFIKDFGKSPEELYSRFNPVPFASASIAQVHEAYLADGTKLAIKVRRPDVDKHVRSDMAILRKLATVAKVFKKDLRHIDTSRVIGELEHWILLETDFKNEVKNIDAVIKYHHKNNEVLKITSEYSNRIVFPNVRKHLSSKNVITMDFMEGVPVRDIESIRNDSRYDIKKSLMALLGGVMRVWMQMDMMYYHGDPHPSNVLIRQNGELGLLDFGILGHLIEKDLEDTRDLMLAVYAGNREQSIRLGLRMNGHPYSEALAQELRPDIEQYLEKAKTESMGFYFMEFIKIYMKHDLPLPYQLVMFGRMVALLDGTTTLALPGNKALDLLNEELQKALRRRVWNNIKNTDLSPILYTLSEKIKKSPEMVATFVEKYFEDPLLLVRDLSEAAGIRQK